MYINTNISPTRAILVIKKAKKNLCINFTDWQIVKIMTLTYQAVLHIDYVPTISVFRELLTKILFK